MSHVAAIKVVVNDLDALEAACKDLGLELRRNQKTYRWFGRWVNDYSAENAAYKHGRNPKDYGTCEHAIGIVGNHHSYEIGVVKNPNGTGYILEYDFWSGGGGMSQYIEGLGPPGTAGKLVAAYANRATINEAQANGYSVDTSQSTDDEIVLELNDYQYA